MIRTGYLRWEIEAEDRRHAADRLAREVVFRGRPTHRCVRVTAPTWQVAAATENFRDGTGTYEELQQALELPWEEVEFTLPDVGPFVFRYAERDRYEMPGFWISKVRQQARMFAHDVVRAAVHIPCLLVSSKALIAAYARLVEWETLRVVEGKSRPQPTNETDPICIKVENYDSELPELVAADLVRDVLEPREFAEFAMHNRVTIVSGGKCYRISRKTHAMIDVWDAQTRRPLARLCVVFRDAGMPSSDEVVMKYLLAKHDPQTLWDVGSRFRPPGKPFEGPIPRASR